MRTPREIYAQYKIMPALQLHQLRVAAVAKLVCSNFKEPVNASDVVLACLFHDMGNIVKFDLSQFPEFLEPEGKAYWEGVQTDFFKKYGTEQHAANEAIARELGLSDAVRSCIAAVAFAKVEQTLAGGSWEEKICEYADTRVSPHGVLPLEERLLEARTRYLARRAKGRVEVQLQDRFEVLLEAERALERNVFAQVTIAPEDITDAAVASGIEELWEYPVA